MDKEQKAIERIQMASRMSLDSYEKPLVCTYSGGKDSDVLLELFKRSGVTFEVHHSHTTADAPETVRHIRKKFKELELMGIKTQIEYPKYKGKRISMWSLIPIKLMPPTRMIRYCCQVLKETGCKNRFIATGVRWSESNARSERQIYEKVGRTKKDAVRVDDETMLITDNGDRRKLLEGCALKAKLVVNPIIDWTHSDIWEYIRAEHIEYNCLYDCGYNRVGCIGCPMASKGRYKEFSDYPQYRQLYIHAFERMLDVRKSKALPNDKWKTGKEVFDWWMEDKQVPGQMTLDEIMNI